MCLQLFHVERNVSFLLKPQALPIELEFIHWIHKSPVWHFDTAVDHRIFLRCTKNNLIQQFFFPPVGPFFLNRPINIEKNKSLPEFNKTFTKLHCVVDYSTWGNFETKLDNLSHTFHTIILKSAALKAHYISVWHVCLFDLLTAYKCRCTRKGPKIRYKDVQKLEIKPKHPYCQEKMILWEFLSLFLWLFLLHYFLQQNYFCPFFTGPLPLLYLPLFPPYPSNPLHADVLFLNIILDPLISCSLFLLMLPSPLLSSPFLLSLQAGMYYIITVFIPAWYIDKQR